MALILASTRPYYDFVSGKHCFANKFHASFFTNIERDVLTCLSLETSLRCPWPLTALCTLVVFTSAPTPKRKQQVRDLQSFFKVSHSVSHNIRPLSSLCEVFQHIIRKLTIWSEAHHGVVIFVFSSSACDVSEWGESADSGWKAADP